MQLTTVCSLKLFIRMCVKISLRCHSSFEDWFASVVDEEPEIDASKDQPKEFPADTTTVNVNDLLARIRNHVLSNRIRIKDFFEDMDPLRSARISKTRFVRCLSFIGISAIGAVNLNKAQIKALCDRYEDQDDCLKVNWKQFEDDIDSGMLQDLSRDGNGGGTKRYGTLQ
jgi:hypothetical protein